MNIRRKLCRNGFSLLEVVVAMALGMVLLGAVWTMFNLLTRRQEVELRQADRNQVTRALHQRLSRDLKSLVPILEQRPRMKLAGPQELAFRRGAPLLPLPLPDINPVEWETPIVFVGRESKLLMQVFIEPIEIESLQTFEPSSSSASRRDEAQPQIPVTKFICYEAGVDDPLDERGDADAEPLSVDDSELFDESVPLIGLTRREYLQLPPEELESIDVDQNDDSNELPKLNRHERTESDQAFANEETEQQSAPILIETVEDIADLELAYYDGQAWTGNWDSRISNQLPVAVRVRYRFLTKSEIAEAQAPVMDEAATTAELVSKRDRDRELAEDQMASEFSEDEQPDFDVEYILLVKVRPVDRNAIPVAPDFNKQKKPEETIRRGRPERLP
ncbi:MAG: prepilin-type N-terminal cleavage/methylation domain-containing protein [Pirellulaceae bacterium]